MKKLSEVKDDIKVKLSDPKVWLTARKIIILTGVVAAGVMAKRHRSSLKIYTYSFGIDSPAKFELTKSVAEAYNRAQKAAEKGVWTWTTGEVANSLKLVFDVDEKDVEPYRMVSDMIRKHVFENGPFKAPSVFLVKN